MLGVMWLNDNFVALSDFDLDVVVDEETATSVYIADCAHLAGFNLYVVDNETAATVDDVESVSTNRRESKSSSLSSSLPLFK